MVWSGLLCQYPLLVCLSAYHVNGPLKVFVFYNINLKEGLRVTVVKRIYHVSGFTDGIS